jgi:hypothetical protein
MASWPSGEEAKFVLTVKLFTPALMNSVDPKVIYLFYIQGVYNVITGIYPTGMDESVSLAALQMQAKFGDHNPTVYVHTGYPQCVWRVGVVTGAMCCACAMGRHVPGYLSHQLKGLLPAPIMPRKTPSQWETEILSRHSLLLPDSRKNAQVCHAYLPVCPHAPLCSHPVSWFAPVDVHHRIEGARVLRMRIFPRFPGIHRQVSKNGLHWHQR